jgi:hypothetical protein
MAGKLVQVATETVTTPVASVTLTGIDSDDVYMLAYNDWRTDTDSPQCRLRVTKSGTADTTANYDYAVKFLEASTSFYDYAVQNATLLAMDSIGTGTSESQNGIFYLYNFNSSSEFSFTTQEQVYIHPNPKTVGFAGGMVHTVASASDGIQLFQSVGNISSGTFTLYKVI